VKAPSFTSSLPYLYKTSPSQSQPCSFHVPQTPITMSHSSLPPSDEGIKPRFDQARINDESCSICTEPLKDVALACTPCKHVFCLSCFKLWIVEEAKRPRLGGRDNDEKVKCPLCREGFSKYLVSSKDGNPASLVGLASSSRNRSVSVWKISLCKYSMGEVLPGRMVPSRPRGERNLRRAFEDDPHGLELFLERGPVPWSPEHGDGYRTPAKQRESLNRALIHESQQGRCG
jgi:hypothetical protein